MPKRKLDKDYTYRGVLYEAGDSVEVPEGFEAGEKVKPGRKPKDDKEENTEDE